MESKNHKYTTRHRLVLCPKTIQQKKARKRRKDSVRMARVAGLGRHDCPPRSPRFRAVELLAECGLARVDSMEVGPEAGHLVLEAPIHLRL